MPFSSQSLTPLSQVTRSFSIFAYETEDPLTQVAADGYFAGAARLVRRGDLILVYAGLADQPAIGLFVVTAVDETRPGVWLADFGGLDIVEAGLRTFRLVPSAEMPAAETRKPARSRKRTTKEG